MKTKYKPGRQLYRLPPCPDYDISGMELWLAALAKEGLFLTEDGFFAGFGCFEVREPQTVKYRLEAVQKQTSVWSDGNAPDPDQLALSEKYAWEYVAKRGDFFIYRTLDPSARELNTDPAVQALALNAVKKRKRQAVLSSVLRLILYPVLLTRGCLLLTAISMKTWWMALMLLFAALMIAGELRAFLHLKAVQKSLKNDGFYPAEPISRKKTAAYFLGKTVKFVLAAVLICAVLRTWGFSVTNEKKIPLRDYAGELPFATIRDFAGAESADYRTTMTGMSMGFNTVEESSDWLAPRCIRYNEHAAVKKADGSVLDGGFYVDYYELGDAALAKRLVRELARFDRLKKNFALLSAPELPADEVLAFLDNLHFPTLILRKGNLVIRASLYQTSASYEIPLADWAAILCESLSD